MKYSEATLVTAAELTGTEGIMVSVDGVSRALPLNELKTWSIPFLPGTGLLVANPQTVTGTRFADPQGIVDVPGAGEGLLVADPQTNSGTRFIDPRGLLPPVTPVNAPTITNLTTIGSTSLRMTWQDNQTNPSDEFIVYCVVTSNQTNAPGYPLTIINSPLQDMLDITALDVNTEYTVTMVAKEGDEQSPLSNARSATTLDTGPPPPTAGWLTYLDEGFDTYNNGMSSANMPVNYGDNLSRIDNARSVSPNNSMMTIAKAGEQNPQGWGWANWPAKLYKGDRLRVTFDVYVPSNFNWMGIQKFVRFQQYDNSGNARGYTTLYLDDGANKPYVDQESYTGPNIKTFTTGTMPARDQWTTFVYEIGIDTVAMNDGGTGQRLVYQNGVNILDYRDHKTLDYDFGFYERLFMSSRWNGVLSQDQYLWYDNYKVEYKRG